MALTSRWGFESAEPSDKRKDNKGGQRLEPEAETKPPRRVSHTCLRRRCPQGRRQPEAMDRRQRQHGRKHDQLEKEQLAVLDSPCGRLSLRRRMLLTQPLGPL